MFQTIGVCGTGNMGRAIVKGLVAAKAIAADHIYLYNIHREKAEALAQETGAVVVCEEHQIMGGLGEERPHFHRCRCFFGKTGLLYRSGNENRPGHAQYAGHGR